PSALAGARGWLKPWVYGLLLLSIMAISLSAGKGRARRQRVAMTWALFAAGFASIVYEIVLLVYYQMSVGLLVWKIGFIITAFMVGAGIGAWIAVEWDRRIARHTLSLVAAMALMAAYVPLLFIVAGASAIIANFGAGMITGFIYQQAARALASDGRGIGRVAGIVQNADLWGAAVGSLIASALAIPLMGLFASLAMASAALIAAIVMVVVLRA
ncbi:MAG: hypothetical protein WC690_05350, partial [bacterium]